MRFIFPKTDIFEEFMFESNDFFTMNNIDASKITPAIYNDLFKSILVNALYFILDWKYINEDEIEQVLTWVIINKRKSIEDAIFYEYFKPQVYLKDSLNNLIKIIDDQVSNEIFGTVEEKNSYMERLIDDYHFHVIDSIDLQIKNILVDTLGNSWNILEVVETKRTLEIIDYGDFRINAWEMYRTKNSE